VDTGSINSLTLSIVMNKDHKVVAHFRKFGGGNPNSDQNHDRNAADLNHDRSI